MATVAKLNCNGDPYMPIRLKGVLERHGLTQAGLAAAMKMPSGHPLSYGSVSLILNWNTWPKTGNQSDLRRQAEAWLASRGVPPDEIAGGWSIDATDAHRFTRPQRAARRLVIVPPEIQAVETEMLSAQAKRHFKLFRDPFHDDVSCADDVFLAADQRYVLEAMHHTARHGGCVAVIGESGSGKSTLRKLLIERLRDQPVRIIFPQTIDKERLNVGNISAAIINDLAPGRKIPARAESQARAVKDILMASANADRQHVLMIEEAHDLTITTIKQLKRFYELENGFRKLLSIVLVAQPELKVKLNEQNYPEAREMIRRIEIAELAPLDGNLESYLALKFKRIDGDVKAVLGADAGDAIRARLSRGRSGQQVGNPQLYPLMVQNLVTKAMNRAAEIGAPLVTAELIREF